MAARMIVAALLLTAITNAGAVEAQSGLSVNPIRKVVNMLQGMQKKIAGESAKKEKMFDAYMCYCNNADGTLGKSISDAETKIPQLESAIKEGAALKKQLEAELKDAQKARVEAKEAIAEAQAIRDREAKAFSKAKSEAEANIGALDKAIPAIEKGMGGAFLQTRAASVLRQISETAEMNTADRDLLASFLSEGDNYAPKSGEIVGILKTMHDEMTKDFADASSDESSAVAAFDSLVASKEKEIDALTNAVESKTGRVGELGVKLAEQENDLEDTTEGLADDKKFLANLDTNCALKKKEWDEYKKMEAMEMVALADTIKILNDDDALELFKKTLPASGSSFMQVAVTSKEMRQRAMSMLKAEHKRDPRFALIEMAMHGGKIGFEKIITMIDNLVVDLKAEQGVDSDKKAYCEAEFDKAEDKKKELDLDISDLGKAIADSEESISTLTSEIAALSDGIKKLDSSVAEATSTRKEEHDDFVETLAANTAAKDILAFAKNRLNKFYNPKMYKAPATAVAAALVQSGAAPPRPPEANLAYKKSGEEGGGVIAMIDLLVADIDKENQIMEVDEKDAQKDYETLMSDAQTKRAEDSKAITDKESAKAETETQLQADTDTKKSKTTEAMETAKFIGGLHEECDWLLSNFDARKAARTGEIDALGKAKAVLSGADYSLVQMSSTHLRGARH
jgi:chromosome segregation ATPase